MLRVMALAVGALACACAPAPASMAPSDAGEHLERFAAGAIANDVCTPQGRALLRGAVRAYGAELARAGVTWPALPENDGGTLRSVDAAVGIAFAAGFVEASDFRGPARIAVNRMALMHWPQIADMRAAGRVSCAQVVDLQRAALRLLAEMERMERVAARANPERLRRQRERVEHAEAQLAAMAAALRREIEEARGR